MKRIINAENKDKIGLVIFGDTHLGHIYTNEDVIKEEIAKVKDRGDYWIQIGDKCEYINRTDPRHYEEELAKWGWLWASFWWVVGGNFWIYYRIITRSR